MKYFKYVVKNKENKITLKSWMQSFNLAKNKINYLIDNKCVIINGVMINKREYELKENDEIIVDVSYYENIDYPPSRYNLEILYEDDYILVVIAKK